MKLDLPKTNSESEEVVGDFLKNDYHSTGIQYEGGFLFGSIPEVIEKVSKTSIVLNSENQFHKTPVIASTLQS